MQVNKPIPSAGKVVDEHLDNVVSGVPLYGDGPQEHRRFTVNGYQDVWAAILFMLSVASIVIWVAVNTSNSNSQRTPEPYNPSTPDAYNTYLQSPTPMPSGNDPQIGQILMGSLLCVAMSIGGAATLLWLLHTHPKQMIIVSNVGFGVINILVGLAIMLSNNVYSGIWGVIIGAAGLVWFAFVYHRVEYSAALLQFSTKLILQYKAILAFKFAAGIAFVVYLILWMCAIFPTISRLSETSQRSKDGTSDADGAISIVVLYGLLCLFWTGQVASNVIHTTAAGVGATWYFCGGSMPSNPTLKSARRALSTSFGSICFGSLLIAILRVIHTVTQTLRRNHNSFAACIVECIMGCLVNLMRIFNHYAFTYIAIYGCGYIDAARRTWDLTQRCAATVLFTDCIVGSTLRITSLYFAVLFGVVWGVHTSSAPVGILAAMLSALVTATVFSSINSVLSSLLVCYADVPEALARTSPELFQLLQVADGAVPNTV